MGLESGATNTLTVVVDESMTADRFGNTGVQVLATPMLVSYFELAAHQLAMPALEPGQGTVGSHIDIRHLAATPIGMRVTFRATLTGRDGRRLLFRVQADDDHERGGEGTHERFVVDMQRWNWPSTARAERHSGRRRRIGDVELFAVVRHRVGRLLGIDAAEHHDIGGHHLNGDARCEWCL
jgi:fluoroacetyl-CoA thioesterase